VYYYILDPNGLPSAKFERLQIELQGLLAEFKISGEVGRITSLRTMGDLVELAAQRGVKTLIACGNDDTFNMMLANIRGRDLTVGFVPFDENAFLGKILGLDSLLTAVKTIAARRIERIDLARVSNTYFISYLELGIVPEQVKNLNWWNSMRSLSKASSAMTIRIDDSYNLDINCLGGMVANTRSTSSKQAHIANPTDGFLDLLILERLRRTDILKYKGAIAEGRWEEVPHTTVIKCRRIDFLEPRGFPITMYNRTIAKFPCTVEIIPQRLKIIVGKNRTF
jgi:diacylglycerol kinase family enzyme